MGSQHVHDYVGAKLPQVVGANNGIPRIVYQIESRLVFDQIAHSFAIFECPLHVCDQSGAHLICGASRVEHVLPHFKHPILIEPAIRKIRLVPIAKFHFDRSSRLGPHLFRQIRNAARGSRGVAD